MIPAISEKKLLHLTTIFSARSVTFSKNKMANMSQILLYVNLWTKVKVYLIGGESYSVLEGGKYPKHNMKYKKYC